MSPVNTANVITPAADLSTVDGCIEAAKSALTAKSYADFRAALASLSALVGDKPKSADYATKEDYKADMNRWDASKRQLRSLLAFADEQGIVVKETFGATATKSGAINIRHARVLSVKPNYGTFRV